MSGGGYVMGEILAPFPWFGSKRRVAAEVWQGLGDVTSYVEPFAGTAAVLLRRPDEHSWWDRTETINDADGLLVNFWRAVQHDPESVAHYADWPVTENDLHARHAWLVGQREPMTARLEGNPLWYDARIAGWWVWGICAWIGRGWCSGKGPWIAEDGLLIRRSAGQGINRQLPHVGSAGRGINRKLPHVGDAGQGHCAAWSEHLAATMQRLADRLRRVRVCCGDWQRVCTPAVVTASRRGPYGVFLDPPYAHAVRDKRLYNHEMSVTDDVREWAIRHGDNPDYRIALCGYDDEHDMPEGWQQYGWRATGGYASQGQNNTNRHRETIWFSPHCIHPLTAARLPIDSAAD